MVATNHDSALPPEKAALAEKANITVVVAHAMFHIGRKSVRKGYQLDYAASPNTLQDRHPGHIPPHLLSAVA